MTSNSAKYRRHCYVTLGDIKHSHEQRLFNEVTKNMAVNFTALTDVLTAFVGLIPNLVDLVVNMVPLLITMMIVGFIGGLFGAIIVALDKAFR